MNIEQVDSLIQQGEGIQVEFKEARDSIPNSFYDTVVSFANTDGGTILLGVEDNGIITGINQEVVSSIRSNIASMLHSPDCINPGIITEPILINHPDGILIAVPISVSKHLHDHAGKIFIRSHESDLDITHDQHQISTIFLRKRDFYAETHLYPHLSISDLDNALFVKAKSLIKGNNENHPWATLDNEEMLRSAQLLRKSDTTGKEAITMAGLLLFGKELAIQNEIPAYKVDVFVKKHDKERWDDRLTLSKNLIDSYIELNQFFEKHLPDKFYMEGIQRINIRNRIFREVIANVIVHRDYTSGEPTIITITENEVLATNPNIAKFHGPIDPNKVNPFPKNPIIRKFFSALGWVEDAGSGIRYLSKYVPLYTTNAKPTFIEDETFKTIIPLVWFTMEKQATHFQQWLDLPDDALPHLTKGLSNISLSNESLAENWEDMLLHLISSWTKKDTKLEQLRWSFNQDSFTELIKKVPSWEQKGAKQKSEISSIDEDQILELIKKVPSWDQKGAKLLSKRSLILITILTLTLEPIKLQDMLEWMDYKKRQSLREIYLDPLMKVGFVSRTIIDKPKDPEQKYVITESGKLFLAGL